MISYTTLICLSVLALEIITGLCSNIFIIISLILPRYKEKYFAPYNIIVIALCFSSMVYSMLMSADVLMSFLFPSLFNMPYVINIIKYMSLYSITSSAWLTASLCFFYFTKIVQFKPGFLAWVKTKIETTVPWMILTVELISLSGSFLAFLVCNEESPKNSTICTAEMNFENDEFRLKFMTLVLMTSSLPVSISILTMAASAWFLKRHSHHIKRNVKGSQAGVKDYESAVKTMSCLIFFYAILFLCMLIFSLPIFKSRSWGFWMCLMAFFSFALIKSGLLIAGNPKLKETWKKMFTCK